MLAYSAKKLATKHRPQRSSFEAPVTTVTTGAKKNTQTRVAHKHTHTCILYIYIYIFFFRTHTSCHISFWTQRWNLHLKENEFEKMASFRSCIFWGFISSLSIFKQISFQLRSVKNSLLPSLRIWWCLVRGRRGDRSLTGLIHFNDRLLSKAMDAHIPQVDLRNIFFFVTEDVRILRPFKDATCCTTLPGKQWKPCWR